MTNDEILQAAKDAGIEKWWDTPNATNEGYQRALLKMGKIIEKRTIERCTDVVYRKAALLGGPIDQAYLHECAAAIRKLGEQE